MNKISFPGLGIGEFTVDPVAFTLPITENGLEIRWYAIFITLGMLLGFAYCLYRTKQHNISTDDMLDMFIFGIISGVIGARLYYVLFTLDSYSSFADIINIRKGGLAIYGGIIGGAIAVICVSRFKKLKLTRVMDCVAPAVMLGQAIGRWGNFFNAEAYGVQLAEGDLLYFLRMGILDVNSTAPSTPYYHPAFFYEFLWNIIGFVLINVFYKKKKFDGQIVLSYLAWYGFGRMFIESIRVDSLMIGVIRVSQVVAFLCFAICTLLLIVFYLKARRAELNEENYDMAFSRVTGIYSPAKSETTTAEAQKSEKTDSVPKTETNTPSDETDVSEETSDTPSGFSDDIAERLKDLFNTENDK